MLKIFPRLTLATYSILNSANQKPQKDLESELPDKKVSVDETENSSKSSDENSKKDSENEPENSNENSRASRDSDSRDAAEQLEKTEEEETDDDKDTYLIRLQQILEKLHSTYYEKYDKLR